MGGAVRGASCQHAAMERNQPVVVVGAGIAGLTAAALLAQEGLQVLLLEAHHQSGGCAGTFRRGPYTFDVGATQVAGLEPGGIHQRLWAHLAIPPPAASPLDPACVVNLGDGQPPVRLWRDPPALAAGTPAAVSRQRPVLAVVRGPAPGQLGLCQPRPGAAAPQRGWDLAQLLGALGPVNLASGLLSLATIADLQRLSGCGADRRLRRFLDLQLRLYSQEPADRTAALYGATVLAMGQEPLGLWHLQGSMQELSRGLEGALQRGGGQLKRRHRVERLLPAGCGWQLQGQGPGGRAFALTAADVVLTLPPQTLETLVGDALPAGYRRRLQHLHEPSGALVFYGAVQRQRLPQNGPSHLQSDWADPGPLFVSVSQEGDGRAPAGQATVIASVFTPARPWFAADLDDPAQRQARKHQAMAGIQAGLEHLLGIGRADWLHGELATPRAFAHWCGRPFGYVGGLGQHPSRFGPFGLASRTPLPGLWLCGDSIHPGEGTAGVSLSALMASRQLMARRGGTLMVA
jgi:C-3',4' desaturase CrtD